MENREDLSKKRSVDNCSGIELSATTQKAGGKWRLITAILNSTTGGILGMACKFKCLEKRAGGAAEVKNAFIRPFSELAFTKLVRPTSRFLPHFKSLGLCAYFILWTCLVIKSFILRKIYPAVEHVVVYPWQRQVKSQYQKSLILLKNKPISLKWFAIGVGKIWKRVHLWGHITEMVSFNIMSSTNLA